MKAISYSCCDRQTDKNPDARYYYETYTVLAAKRITQETLMKYVMSKRVETFSAVTNFWYFDIEKYQKDLEFSGVEIPKDAI